MEDLVFRVRNMRMIAAIILLTVSLITGAAASSGDQPDIRLINGGYSGASGTALLGLNISMAEGWHTYWKTAGEGGFPPEFDTSSSENLASFEVKWPAPQKIETISATGSSDLQTNGFMNSVVLPILVKSIDPNKETIVSISLRVYACKDYCSAFERSLTANVSPGVTVASAQREIADWLKRVPRSSDASLSIAPPDSLGGRFSVDVKSTSDMSGAWLYVSNADNTPYTIETTDVGPGLMRFIVTPEDGSFSKSSKLEFVATLDGKAVTATYERPATKTSLSWAIILTAFLGGLVLNVMPCVFPVLSLKLMSLTSGDHLKAKRGFAASSIGIIGSFVAIGAVLACMKAAGAEIGWGIQFQSVMFLASMTVLILAFALGTAGLFEVALPPAVATKLTQMTDGHGFGASVAQGFVATLLATPCSAPFVGTAVGFALAGNTMSILAVFAAMGFGMALPYLIIAVLPGVSRFFPRPGAWMQRVRLALSLALFATAGWLAVTFSSALSDNFYWVLLGIASTACVGLLLHGNLHRGKQRRSLFTVLAAIVFAAPGVSTKIMGAQDLGIRWQEFSPETIHALVADNKTVVVNITADWCLTCKVNDRTTWSNTETIDLVERNTIPMKADWTRPDPSILKFLRSHGRFGIPFTIVYSPRNPEGTVLPEILSPSTISGVIVR